MNEEYDVIVLGTGLTVREPRHTTLCSLWESFATCYGTEITGPNQAKWLAQPVMESNGSLLTASAGNTKDTGPELTPV